jgi:hypothetical protein
LGPLGTCKAVTSLCHSVPERRLWDANSQKCRWQKVWWIRMVNGQKKDRTQNGLTFLNKKGMEYEFNDADIRLLW